MNSDDQKIEKKFHYILKINNIGLYLPRDKNLRCNILNSIPPPEMLTDISGHNFTQASIKEFSRENITRELVKNQMSILLNSRITNTLKDKPKGDKEKNKKKSNSRSTINLLKYSMLNPNNNKLQKKDNVFSTNSDENDSKNGTDYSENNDNSDYNTYDNDADSNDLTEEGDYGGNDDDNDKSDDDVVLVDKFENDNDEEEEDEEEEEEEEVDDNKRGNSDGKNGKSHRNNDNNDDENEEGNYEEYNDDQQDDGDANEISINFKKNISNSKNSKNSSHKININEYDDDIKNDNDSNCKKHSNESHFISGKKRKNLMHILRTKKGIDKDFPLSVSFHHYRLQHKEKSKHNRYKKMPGENIYGIKTAFKSNTDFESTKVCFDDAFREISTELDLDTPVSVCSEPDCLESVIPGFNYCIRHIGFDKKFESQNVFRKCHASINGVQCCCPVFSSDNYCNGHQYLKAHQK